MFEKLVTKLRKRFGVKSQEDIEYEYLCEALDLIDLERRQRQIDQGLLLRR